MLANIRFAGLVKHDQLLLIQLYSFIVQFHIDLRQTVFGLIDDDVAGAFYMLFHI